MNLVYKQDGGAFVQSLIGARFLDLLSNLGHVALHAAEIAEAGGSVAGHQAR